MKRLLRPLASLSLAANHAVGSFLGRVAFLLSPRYRRRLLDNLAASGLAATPGDVRRIGWESVEKLRASGKAIVFVIPHLGGYDVAGRYLWTQVPILAMYRPHKLHWFDQMMREGRNRGAAPDGTNTAPATMAGVRMILKHLRRGGCSIVLPDQVPGQGDGEWVDFFGRPAYTMTLVGRLQEASDAAIVFCFAERLPRGEGFVLHCEALAEALPLERHEAARRVNAMVERLVRLAPAQYLWGYNRYKRPAGAPPPPSRP